MQLTIDKTLAEELLKTLPPDSELAVDLGEGMTFRGECVVDCNRFSDDMIQMIIAAAQKADARGIVIVCNGILKARQDPSGAKITSMKALEDAIVTYLLRGCIDGWLYYKAQDGFFEPMLVGAIRYHPTIPKQQEEHVTINCYANSKDGQGGTRSRGEVEVSSEKIHLRKDQCVGKTVDQIFVEMGWYHETPELKAIYEKHFALFRQMRPKFSQQFVCEGPIMIMEDEESSHGSRYKRPEARNTNGFPFRCVNDEELNDKRTFVDRRRSDFWETSRGRHKLDENAFTKLPHDLRLYMYHLDLHQQFWVHVACLKPYVYDTKLGEKLVLPDSHRDLIEVLVNDGAVLVDDIVQGKSGGTTILSYGPPGLGKTLTAEVYAEVIEKPILKVNAGMLGITIEEVEANLKEILKRVQRWQAILLLDEADVYIRKRANDLTQNAIVAVFLRTLEYFNGLFFMTTNRGDDVDDAIMSRCIARIHYETPDAKNLYALWKILGKQFGADLEPSLINELVEAWPQMSGRDVKELLKLTMRYVRCRDLEYSLDVFRKMGQFRGLI